MLLVAFILLTTPRVRFVEGSTLAAICASVAPLFASDRRRFASSAFMVAIDL